MAARVLQTNGTPGNRPAACPRGRTMIPEPRSGRVHLVKYTLRGVLHAFAQCDADFRRE